MEATENWPVHLIKGFVPTKQILINFIEIEPMIAFNYYESDDFHNVEILFASEVALTHMINRIPEGVMFHVNAKSNHFEFFIDKEFNNDTEDDK